MGDTAPDVYVQIPAYRDRELAPTLRDLYRKAAHPERLRVAVLWQRAADEDLPASVRALPNLELLDVPYEQSRGCNWARVQLQDRWHGEPYTLLLDSHHRFVRGWDDLVVSMYEGLRDRGVERPLLTTYLPGYDPALEPRGRKRVPYRIYPMSREDGVLTRLTSYPLPFWRRLDAPVEAEFLSLHFVFAAGGFNTDVRFDPDIYFFGDEVAVGLRAYTHGYDLYHPHRVVGWHAYDRAARVTHWADHDGWYRQHEAALDKLRALFRGEDGGAGWLGTRRSIADYEAHIMADLVAA
jgi:hypothetical protein